MQQPFPCQRCGTPIYIGQRVCSACGQRIDYRCAHCGAVTESLSRFCVNCGQGLCAGAPPPQAPVHPHPAVYPGAQSARPTRPLLLSRNWVGTWVGSMVALLCIGAVLYVISTSSETAAYGGNSGGFVFQESHSAPASSPAPDVAPRAPDSLPQQKPIQVTGTSRYTADEVIKLANIFSPDCRKVTRRWT